jgi:creatinine amidohydrolase
MRPDDVARTLADDSRLIIPIGTCERYDAALPLGCATILAERLADDLSAEFGVLRAPTVEYGVNVEKSEYPGRVALRKKTLHRALNDMVASWECNGVSELILLTAHGYDPHQEALGTISTTTARVRVVDAFAVNLLDLLPGQTQNTDRSATFLALLGYIAPDLVGATKHPAAPHDAELGRSLYDRMRTRISERIFLAPAPAE